MGYPGQKYRQQSHHQPPPQPFSQGYNPSDQSYSQGYAPPPTQGHGPPPQGYAPPPQGYGPPPPQGFGQPHAQPYLGVPSGGMPMPTPSTNPYFGNQPPMQGYNYPPSFPQPSHNPPPQRVGQPFPVPDFSNAGPYNNFNPPPQPPPQNQAMFNQPPPVQQAPLSQPLPPGVSGSIPVSNFSGRKKALLIGVNYYGTNAELRGCINDVRNIRNFICRHYGFSTDSMVILTDDQKDNPTRIPTRANIIQAMKWLVSDARPNDSLFFHFSGHGSQQEDTDGDEEDGYDETICPVDFKKAGMIVDDEMNLLMVRPLPPGCRLTAIFDCCHSGTALDLPYTYDQHGKLIAYSPAKKVKNVALDLGKKYLMGDMVGALMSLKKGASAFKSGKNAQKISQETRGTVADVAMFSGCEDNQTSADAVEQGVGNTGAMSFALIKALYSNPYGLSYLQLLAQVRTILRGKYSQVPQLSSGRPMDMNQYFSM